MSDNENHEEHNDQNQNHKRIGNYIIGDTIGEGAFGKVKKATHVQTNEKVAVKVLNKQRMQELSGDVSKLQKEINILKKLRHKNIIQLYEIMESKTNLFLIIEFCPKGELFDYIVKRKKLSEFTACKLFQNLIDGIDYLHSNNIVHRDLKPENLLLDEKLNLKISDFGLSTTYNGLISTPCGTPSYAPPEMLRGQKYVGVKSDIWSCGIILYAMLCGYLPYSDSKEEIILERILRKDYKIPDFLSTKAKDLLIRMLDNDPEKRFDIKQVKEHSWFKQTEPSLRPGIFIGVNQIPVDEVILNKVFELNANLKPNEKFNLTKEELRRKIKENKFENCTACYYLLLRKHIALGGTSVSDLQSKAYMTFITNPSNLLDVTEMMYAEQVIKADSKVNLSPNNKDTAAKTMMPSLSSKATVQSENSGNNNSSSGNNDQASIAQNKQKKVSITIDEIYNKKNKRSKTSRKEEETVKEKEKEKASNIAVYKPESSKTPVLTQKVFNDEKEKKVNEYTSPEVKRSEVMRKDNRQNTITPNLKTKTEIKKNNLSSSNIGNLVSPRDKKKAEAVKKTTDYRIPGAAINLPFSNNKPVSKTTPSNVNVNVNSNKNDTKKDKNSIIDIISEKIAMKKLSSFLPKDSSVKHIKSSSASNEEAQKDDSSKTLQKVTLNPMMDKQLTMTDAKSPKYNLTSNSGVGKKRSVKGSTDLTTKLQELRGQFKALSIKPDTSNNTNKNEEIVNFFNNINQKYTDFVQNTNKENIFRVIPNKKIETKRKSIETGMKNEKKSSLISEGGKSLDKEIRMNKQMSKESIHFMVKHKRKFNFRQKSVLRKGSFRDKSISSRNNKVKKEERIFNDISAIYRSDIDYNSSFDNESVHYSPSPLIQKRKASSRRHSIRNSFINTSEINLNIENEDDDDDSPFQKTTQKAIPKGKINISKLGDFPIESKDKEIKEIKLINKPTISKQYKKEMTSYLNTNSNISKQLNPNLTPNNKIIFTHKNKKEEAKDSKLKSQPIASKMVKPMTKQQLKPDKDDIIKLY